MKKLVSSKSIAKLGSTGKNPLDKKAFMPGNISPKTTTFMENSVIEHLQKVHEGSNKRRPSEPGTTLGAEDTPGETNHEQFPCKFF